MYDVSSGQNKLRCLFKQWNETVDHESRTDHEEVIYGLTAMLEEIDSHTDQDSRPILVALRQKVALAVEGTSGEYKKMWGEEIP